MNTDQFALFRALTRADHPQVKLLLHDGSVLRISAHAARLRVRSEGYAWFGSPKRVKLMRALKPPAPWQPCYRTQESVSLMPSIEWMQSRETKTRTIPA